jgi:hypothetical protein
MFLEMADDGLNGSTPFELALDLRREAAGVKPAGKPTKMRTGRDG